ncbi:uncharacterized protein LOC111347384 [Stylophora pistillata]|uniref:uncharacterized protein LOC111347384 n=1 Tax=Stylophora pistillata TaxID=50429 RepID=UPI000C04EBFF|nr:uncharacterized protein LOC111347384 [Stylophora pistillata]
MYKDYNKHYGLCNNIGCKAKTGIAGYICEGSNGCYFERVVTKVGDLNCKNDNDYFTLYLTIAVLAGFLFVILVILFGVFRQQKKQKKDARKETVIQNQHDYGESLLLNALKVGAQLSLAAGSKKNESEPSVQQEGVYTALCSETMMTSGEEGSRTYTSLVKSREEDSETDYVHQIPAPEYVNA